MRKNYITLLGIRDGIWLDPKENNVGIINQFSDIESKYDNNVELYNTGKNFKNYQGNSYIIDYEDVVFLTPEIIKNFNMSNSYNQLPYGVYPGNRIYTSNLGTQDIEEIYEKNYIYPSETLLTYEQEYQKEIGNLEKANACKMRLKEIEQKRKQSEYETEQRFKYGRNYSDIGKKFSAKEIGIQVLQKTRLSRIKDMVYAIKEKFKTRKNRKIDAYSNEFEEKAGKENLVESSDKSDPWRTL